MSGSKERLERLQAAMAEQDIDMVAIGPTAGMRYLLHVNPFADERLCLLLVGRSAVHLVAPALNAAKIAEHTDLPMSAWSDDDGPERALAEGLRVIGSAAGRIAVDGAMRADFALPVLALLRPVETVSAGPLLATLRIRKGPAELAALQRAAEQADRAMQAGVDACRVGATEAEIAWAIESAFRLDGAERVEFALVASGPNSAFPHHEAGPRRLQPGDAVVLDIGATLDGYQSDITRMVHMGAPSAEFTAAYNAVLAANKRGREAVRPGIAAGEVDRITRQVLVDAGLGSLFIHRTGHGLGIEGHEPPWIKAGNPAALDEGMVFSIEPGVYLPGKFGIRIEDIVAVTADGVQTLTGFERGLVVK